MRVLVACEHSGVVREAFRVRGHSAWSCDFLPSDDNSPYHAQCDVRKLLHIKWDLMIAHPDCTYLTNAAAWLYQDEISVKLKPSTLFGADRSAARTEAAAFVKELYDCAIPKIAIENPVGAIPRLLPDLPKPQYIQPYMFGDDASKKTGLWLKGLPKLVIPEQDMWYPPRLIHSGTKTLKRWSNQTDSGQNNTPPSTDRWQLRSKTYAGIANALAEQWG